MESWNDGIMKERQKAVQIVKIVKIVEVVQIAKTVINTGMMEYWNIGIMKVRNPLRS
jgi:hypothetical protein